MSTRRHLLRARFDTVRRDLEEVLGRMQPDWMDWAPTEGMRTLGGQLFEIAVTEHQLITLLRDDVWVDEEEYRASLGRWNDFDVLRSALAEIRGNTLGYLDSLSEEQLAEEVEFGGGWFGSLGLEKIPRAEAFVNVADHEWYHVGQITSYLWARGIDPYG